MTAIAPSAAPGRLAPYARAIDSLVVAPVRGRVCRMVGLIIESLGPHAAIGDICLLCDGGDVAGKAEVVGFRDGRLLLMSLGPMESLKPGMDVIATGRPLCVPVGNGLLGRILDGLGEPLDKRGPLLLDEETSLYNLPPNPLQRSRIHEPLCTGIRSIDGFRTLGKGQRMGIFAGSGVGKSVLMGMIARNCRADINVIALIGERGREVREFLEKDLGEEGLRRSVVIVATSEQPAVIRLKAALVATSIAEHFRDKGSDVMLMMDSATRLAQAQREVGLAAGEPPATRGYTPSVFTMLPKLFERAGMGDKGSITGLYTVLVEGDDLEEPVADSVRSILDGHLVLSRALANKGHFPAIDILKSVSRCMSDVTSPEHRQVVGRLQRSMAAYAEAEDMIQLGAYVKGSNRELDLAIALREPLQAYLVQSVEDGCSLEDSISLLTRLSQQLQAAEKKGNT